MAMSRVLVVDDDPLIRQLLTYQLGGAGYQISTAQNGREALERLLFDKPDLVLLDVVMPDMSGWEVCQHLRTYSMVPIIMLTAKSAESDVVRGLERGADDYISKPFGLPQLLARIEAVLRRSIAEQPAPTRHPLANSSTPDPHLRFANETYPAWSSTPPFRPVSLSSAPVAPPAAPAPAAPTPTRDFLGHQLAEARKMRGLTLHQAEAACGIRWEFLQAIEREYYSYIPHGQLRHMLTTYSNFLEVTLPSAPPPPPTFRSFSTWSIYLAVIVSIMLLIVLLFSSFLFF